MQISDFHGTSPAFLPELFLVGRLQGWGVLETVLGDLRKRFTISAEGTADIASGAFKFSEPWPFDDGWADTLFYRIDERVRIVRGSAGRLGLPFAVAHVAYRRVGAD